MSTGRYIDPDTLKKPLRWQMSRFMNKAELRIVNGTDVPANAVINTP